MANRQAWDAEDRGPAATKRAGHSRPSIPPAVPHGSGMPFGLLVLLTSHRLQQADLRMSSPWGSGPSGRYKQTWDAEHGATTRHAEHSRHAVHIDVPSTDMHMGGAGAQCMLCVILSPLDWEKAAIM